MQAHFSGTCQGVIALNMEDGTLHRFRASNTILATGVRTSLRIKYWLFIFIYWIFIAMSLFFNRVMVEPTSQQLQPTHVLVMATLWLRVPDYPFRLVFWTKPDYFDYFTVSFDYTAPICTAGSWVCAVPSYGHLWCWMPDYWRLYISNPFFLCLA